MQPLLFALEDALRTYGAGVLAFDADGTLWSGDVGEDVFLHATQHGLLRPAALPALQALAREYDIGLFPEANEQARALYDAYLRRELPELHACEMMAWGFAGWGRAELERSVESALEDARLSSRHYAPLASVRTWATERGLPCYVVSASPDFVIEVATKPLGFAQASIAACTPARTSDDVLLPHLAAPLPYLEHKVHALSRVAPGCHLLAAFGDNSFDVPLLRAARLAVAVRPKPALQAVLKELPDALVLCEG
jgi:phosphatidylglycerophosphatase C